MNRFFRRLLKLSLSGLCFVHDPTEATAQSAYAPIDSTVASFMSDMKVPGFAVAIVKDSDALWSKAYGESNIESKIPMSVDGIMNIGSISKTFTTAAAMQLWEKGLLDLNEDINTYLDFQVRNPKYPETPITILQILTHTSSIRDGKAYIHSYTCGDPTISLHDWVSGNLTSNGQFFNAGDNFEAWAPGTGKRRYSNVSFGLLGLIVEKVAKQPFHKYCKQHIFAPLGMIHTAWMLEEVDPKTHIIPYAYVTQENRKDLQESQLYPAVEFKIGTYLPACLYSFPNYPDGLVRTSVRELSFYLIAMMNGGSYKGQRILQKKTVDKMLSLQNTGHNTQGLTWHIYEWDSPTATRETLWGHTGGDPGITTYLFFNPVSRLGMITFQNASTGGTSRLFEKLYQIAASEKFDETESDLQPQKRVSFMPIRFTGRQKAGMYCSLVRLMYDSERTILRVMAHFPV
ncbi:beta-lactamase family protein [Dyadobacter sp. CY261]|uniref:serine hydrolase domain-containing protein n=1 Tax=Dyadobacter sp. CY261 TaxID=2907203 RepID=UPI001F33A9DF|nr:serine hydrolase [Dyadobacter sp. CY261]MCF0075697.1 beta-lactamase family protein [Dyadobacter sp. CY261]